MPALNAITLLINAITLMLALSFLLLILWQDRRKELNQFFAIFLFLVTVWNAGALLTEAVLLVSADLPPLVNLAFGILELGFTGSSIAVYILTTVLTGMYTRRFRLLALVSLVLVLGYRLLLISGNSSIVLITNQSYRFPSLALAFYLLFDLAALYLVWRYRRKLRSGLQMVSVMLFIIGQSAGFLNPELPIIWISTNISSIAALLLSYTILQQEIITPLRERGTQVEAIHRVSLAISSQIALDMVLDEIARQAAGWLDADASGIFLVEGTRLHLATVYNLPKHYLHTRLKIGEGVVGTVAQTQSSIHLDNYRRDWRGRHDFPEAPETFGSVICVPLTYTQQVIGVLMVIAGKHSRLFAADDVFLLKLLSAQAAVAIAHSRSFDAQRRLTQQVETARDQLSSLLVSTENPVVAVNRTFHLIFANPAARKLFNLPAAVPNVPLPHLLPPDALPPDTRRALHDLRHNRVHIYEISLDDKVYLCHLARIGQHSGWVAVLNDVTQLKELDRIKSEMVRMTSHDLKNPLQAAMANLDLLRDDLEAVTRTTPDVQTGIDAIEKQLQRMNRIIRGILDLERLKSGKLSFEVCTPARIIAHVADDLKPFAADQHITLETHVDPNAPEVQVDAEQFERALINLVENAIKFTPPGGTVWLGVAPHDANQVLFTVRDTGIGIPAALHGRIFDRFFRGQQKGVEHVSGSGLGLSLVKTIVDNHRGTVWLSSEEGHGTTFYVALPTTLESTRSLPRVREITRKS